MTATMMMTLEEVAALHAGDVDGDDVTVGESAPFLEKYYETTPRYNYRGGVTGMFYDKVVEVASILEQADEWPFPALAAKHGVLYDGHHRANAALLVGWSKPIPVDSNYYSNGAGDKYPQDSNWADDEEDY